MKLSRCAVLLGDSCCVIYHLASTPTENRSHTPLTLNRLTALRQDMSTTTSRVVIIGGGFAGCKVAQLLLAEPNFQVTLIDPSNFFEVTWVNLRALVAPEWAQRSIIPYTTILRGNFKHIQGEVASIEAKKVLTKSGQEVEFDFCVIAVGSSYAGFLKAAATTTAAAQRLSEIHALNQQITGASSVLVVGGGPSGVELAAEILEAHPSKKVTCPPFKRRFSPSNSLALKSLAAHPGPLHRPSPPRLDRRCQCVRSQTPQGARCSRASQLQGHAVRQRLEAVQRLHRRCRRCISGVARNCPQHYFLFSFCSHHIISDPLLPFAVDYRFES
jgi:hypothetical protein